MVTELPKQWHNIFFLNHVFFVTQQPKSGLGRLIVEVARSHTISHTEGVGFPGTSDQIVAKTATDTTHKMQHTEETKTHALSRIRTRDTSNQAASDLGL